MNPAVLNLAQLHDVSQNDISFEKELIQVYRDELLKTVVNLETVLRTGDKEASVRLSHDIKGSSANIGAEAVRQIGAQMEALCKDSKFSEAATFLPLVKQSFEKTLQAFAEYFRSHGVAV